MRQTNEKHHQRVWDWLPWYANGSLSRHEAAQVETHLAGCCACKQELTRCRDLSVAVKSSAKDAWAPSLEHWARVLATVEAAEACPGWRALMHKFRAWLTQTPRPMRWTLAFQGALLLALAGVIFVQTAPPQLYETLSRPTERLRSDRLTLRMVFTEDITEHELRELLQSMGAGIVQGPSSLGVYTVELPADASVAGGLTQLLANIRAHPKVRLEEPLAP